MNGKVLIGMSGGVDSSVAALLLKKAGYDVIGLHFSLTKKEEDLCDVRSVCEKLNIPLVTRDFSSDFDELVFNPFLNEYKSGLTPNICVECNRQIKFGRMFLEAQKLDCDYVATGHYCTIINLYGHFYLKKGSDSLKDQSYFLNGLTEEKLKKIVFPLSSFTKERVRKTAEENELVTAHKKGSSDICIAGDRDFRDFLRDYIPPNKGDIVSDKGEVVGKHDGLFNYTLGQRKGLNLGGKRGESGGRWFVIDKNVEKNLLVVTHGSEEKLFTKEVTVENFNFINGMPQQKTFRCTGKTRYREPDTPATAYIDGNLLKVVFDEPKRAVTAGQYCVLYSSSDEKEGVVIGGGKILY